MSSVIPYRPLGLIRELLEGQGFSVTHCFEELVFVDHNGFLLQMGKKGEDVNLVFNIDCARDKRHEIGETLARAGEEMGLKITARGSYGMTANEADETISIEFRPC